jgi:hypothetical protein
MKIIDERVSQREVVEISDELVSCLAEILYNNYNITIGADSEQFLSKKFKESLFQLFNIKKK